MNGAWGAWVWSLVLVLAARDDGDLLDVAAKARLHAARIEAIYRSKPIALVANIVCAIPLVLLIVQPGPTPASLGWLAAMIIFSSSRLELCRRFARDERRVHHMALWTAISVGGSALSGMLWGFGELVLASAHASDHWIWSLAIGGMCAGAVALHSAHAASALCFTVPAGLALAVRTGLNSGGAGLASVLLVLAFVGFTTVIVLLRSAEFRDAFLLRLRLERQTLIQEEANQRLQSEITEHQRTSRMLDETRKMEAIGRLTAGIAHDFNNLLAIILTNLELIGRRSQGPDIARFASTAVAAVQGGAQLTSGLLAFARQQALNPTLVDLNAQIERFMPLLVQAAGADVTLSFESCDGPTPTLIDTGQLQVALLNLVLNARDAIGGQGSIVIATSQAKLEEPRHGRDGLDIAPGPFVRITVTDTGSGIAPDIADKIFEPFFTTKGVGKGTGLGLSQVYGFVTQSGGFVDVRTALGHGTTMQISIPRVAGAIEAPAEPPRHRDMPAHSKPCILLVDDNASILVSLREPFVEQGWEVLMAQDGDAARLMLQHYPKVSVVLTDLNMPVCGGQELIGEIRRVRPDISIIAMSGSPVDDLPGDVYFLAKPFAVCQMMDMMRRACAA